MPDIQAFRGIRYDLGHVGSLSDVIAPPYDVIDAELQTAALRQAPGQRRAADPQPRRAGRRRAQQSLHARRHGCCATGSAKACCSPRPSRRSTSITRCSPKAASTHTRRGFMCRVRLERFGEGNIYPHEETHGGAKADRLKLWTACKANLSQIFGLYPDAENEAQNLLEAAIVGVSAARSDRPPGRRPSHLAGDRRRDDHRRHRRDGRPARVHRRRPPPLRNGLQLPRQFSG